MPFLSPPHTDDESFFPLFLPSFCLSVFLSFLLSLRGDSDNALVVCLCLQLLCACVCLSNYLPACLPARAARTERPSPKKCSSSPSGSPSCPDSSAPSTCRTAPRGSRASGSRRATTSRIFRRPRWTARAPSTVEELPPPPRRRRPRRRRRRKARVPAHRKEASSPCSAASSSTWQRCCGRAGRPPFTVRRQRQIPDTKAGHSPRASRSHPSAFFCSSS